MRLVIIVGIILVVGLAFGAAYRELLPPQPAAPAAPQQTWLEHNLDAIVPADALAPTSTAVFGAAAGGLVGYALLRSPAALALGALAGYLVGAGALGPLIAPPPMSQIR